MSSEVTELTFSDLSSNSMKSMAFKAVKVIVVEASSDFSVILNSLR